MFGKRNQAKNDARSTQPGAPGMVSGSVQQPIPGGYPSAPYPGYPAAPQMPPPAAPGRQIALVLLSADYRRSEELLRALEYQGGQGRYAVTWVENIEGLMGAI